MVSRVTQWKHDRLRVVQIPLIKSKMKSGCPCGEARIECLSLELKDGKGKLPGWNPWNWWNRAGLNPGHLVEELDKFTVACLNCMATRGKFEEIRATRWPE